MSAGKERVFIAGIDEAGYGPPLGPLVISAAVFEVPAPGLCLWKALRPPVFKGLSHRPGAIQVNDSKKVFSQNRGIACLERSVLAFRPPAKMPAALYEMLAELCPADFRPEGRWYDAEDVLVPAATPPEEILSLHEALQKKMSAAGVALRRLYTLPVHPCRMNRLLEKSGNKSILLFEETITLLRLILAEFGSQQLEIIADKHGGRHYYEPLLAQAFPMSRIEALREGPVESVYRIEAAEGRALLTFRESAESACMATALASMVSKYVRELFMSAFNRFWLSLQPGLCGTAGYAVDAARFLGEIAPRLEEMNVPRNSLVRLR